MRSGEDFRVTVRRGVKAVQPTLVTHVVLPTALETGTTSVGFVVSRSVGSAVDRNRVRRRLRHLMRTRMSEVAEGSRIVIRALPTANGASSTSLADDLDEALRRARAR